MNQNVPKTSKDFNDLGAWLAEDGKHNEAVYVLNQALIIDPTNAEAYLNLGNSLIKLGDHTNAAICLKRSLKYNPRLTSAYHPLGFALEKSGQRLEALKMYKKALKISPNDPELLNNIGNHHLRNSSLKEAEEFLLKANTIDSTNPTINNNIGILHYKLGQYASSTLYFKKTLQLAPKFEEAHYQLSLSYLDSGQLEEALKTIQKASEIFPDSTKILSWLHYLKRQALDWEGMDELSVKINKRPELEEPFSSVTRIANPKINQITATAAAEKIESKAKNLSINLKFQKRKKDKLTIGYLSDGFRDFPTGHKLAGLFQYHNKTKFQTICFSYGQDDKSYYRKKIENDCDTFIDIKAKDPVKIANLIRKERVDILVELKGHSKNNMLDVCALKPAPIIISWLGYPGTTGADFIDYAIVDKTTLPKANQKYWTERLILLPETYQFPDQNQLTSVEKATKKQFSLPKGKFVFASFNHEYKITKKIFDAWLQILKKCPNSVLWLLIENDLPRENILKYIRSKQISKKRIIFTKKIPKKSHLSRIKLAGLILDTDIANGHTSTIDALYMNVPVLTISGNHFCSRVSGSLLKACKIKGLIAKDHPDYIKKATSLYKKNVKINTIKAKLFDNANFVYNLEKAYQKVWNNYLQGNNPKNLTISNSKNKNKIYKPKIDNAVSLFEKAHKANKKSQFKVAHRLYTESLKMDPNFLDANLEFANLHYKLKNYKKALPLYKRASKYISRDKAIKERIEELTNL